jgi:hypothetical protein
MSSPIYGRPTGPLRVVSEKPEVNGWRIVCCGWCSGQIAARHVRPSSVASQMEAVTNSAHRARALKGRPHNNGANASEVRAGTRAAMGVELVPATMAGVLSALKAGKAAVYNHEYGALPAYLRNQSGSFGHSAALCYYRRSAGVDYVGWYDPLAAQGSQGIWAKWSDLLKAAWSGEQHSVTRLGAPAPPVPPDPEPEPPVPPDPEPEPPIPPVEPPIPPVEPPVPQLPAARLWPVPSPSWGLVSWPAPMPAHPPVPSGSWWELTSWQPDPWGAVWNSDAWSAGAWSSGRW